MSVRSTRRRGFIKLCAAATAAISARPHLLSAAAAAPLREYGRARLIHPAGETIHADELLVGESYVFHYPYRTTPCFLINLGAPPDKSVVLETESGDSYEWQGGVGPQNSIVAFSAICAHKMSHPARAVSFINYRADQAIFFDADKQRRKRSDVIFCCSERSVYDPRAGAKVLGGPAPQPLAAIMLDYDDADGSLTATGTRGGEMFDQYFTKFAFRLQLEHRVSDVRLASGETTELYSVADYCATLVKC
ncbi:MAG: hypothetical protein OET44_03415 [Gammaproteobacteria bacterium]|nr:hypothetical protein [Gammaproteobacteria bacterium]